MTGLAPAFIEKAQERIERFAAERDHAELAATARTWAYLACHSLTRVHADPVDTAIAVEVARDWANLAVAADKAAVDLVLPGPGGWVDRTIEASLATVDAELGMSR